ncbi:MAG: 30S ribosomal protein S17 [Gammaproteobacteria bacterium]
MNETVDSVKGTRTLTGRVVSNKMDKTIVVEVERVVTHPVYGKVMRRRSRIMAHDASDACVEGDLVTIIQCRPLSRHKSWTLLKVVGHVATETTEDPTAQVGAQP